jgi:pimeloyl-ACP methyl ester carboxylesterase
MAKDVEMRDVEAPGSRRAWPAGGEPLGEYEEIELHGHRVSFQAAGSGDEVVVLLHGITSTAEAWREVMPQLAKRYTVIAPDMIGHGRSAKPRGDYSLGAYAAGVRDLLAVLGFERGSVVGHSFGGGIAMQFSYLFPEYVERMALISSGGLGREVHPLLRAATLPGSDWVLPLIARDFPVRAGEAVRSVAAKLGIEAGPDLAEFARGYASLTEEGASEAFIHTMRSVIDQGGQRVSALDRLYLADQMPTLIVWGDADPVIPVEHGRNAHRIVEHSRYVEFEGSGHWPMLDAPNRLVDELTSFIEETEPFEWSLERVRERLRRGPQSAPAELTASAGPTGTT